MNMKNAIDFIRNDQNISDDLKRTLGKVREIVDFHKAVQQIKACTSDLKRTLPDSEEITVDLGELGELPATVEYEGIPADIDGSGRREPAHLIVMSVKVHGVDLMPILNAIHRDGLQGVADKVEEKLRERCAPDPEAA